MASAMEFGVSLPSRGPLAKPEIVLKIAAKAEALGYASIFVSDHIVLPISAARSVYPYSPTGQLPGGADQDYLDPLAMLAHLAHATTKVRLGTSVLVVPYRNPLTTAKMLATIDVLSRGRVILGAGVGWLREEFEAVGAPPFDERGRVTDEYLTLMRATWTTDPVTFAGRHYKVRDVHALPKPAQRAGIPIWIGGHTDSALRRTATLGDAWHPIGLRPPALLLPDEYAAKVKQLHSYAQQAGRDQRTIALTFRAPMEVRGARAKGPGGDRPLFQGTAAEVIDDVRRYQALGVSHMVFDPVRPDVPAALASLERFAHDVRPKVSRR
jgi:probable F420-dependent oxidoreductase